MHSLPVSTRPGNMDCMYSIVALFLFSFTQCHCVPGDPVMYLPPFEVRTMENNRVNMPFGNGVFQPISQPADSAFAEMQQQQILHTTPAPTEPPAPPAPPAPSRVEEKQDQKHHNFTFTEFVEALNHLESDGDIHDQARAAAHGYPQFPSYPAPNMYGYSRPYGYSYPQRPLAFGQMNGHHEPAAYSPDTAYPHAAPYSPQAPYLPQAAYSHPSTLHHHHSGAKTLTPELASVFLKPVATKAASKLSGLIGLVLSLFGGSSGNSEMKGLFDIVINGIVKPLLMAKGGIKALISKLAIPVIALGLINLEFLITVWWMWEDCPEPAAAIVTPPVYPYPKPAYPNYTSNSYR